MQSAWNPCASFALGAAFDIKGGKPPFLFSSAKVEDRDEGDIRCQSLAAAMRILRADSFCIASVEVPSASAARGQILDILGLLSIERDVQDRVAGKLHAA